MDSSAETHKRTVRFQVEDEGVELEGVLHLVDDTDRAAMALHPHPLYGGDMRNHVTEVVAEALARAGRTTLRFNFRGVGSSSGRHGGGQAETADVAAAVRFLREKCGARDILLAGYSFGAHVALLSILKGLKVSRLILISPPFAMFPPPAGKFPSIPTLVAAGDRDEFAPRHKIMAWAGNNGLPPENLHMVPGVDHFWSRELERLAQLAADFAG